MEECVRRFCIENFKACKKAAARVKAWPAVREALLGYLEKGTPPWDRKDWPLPASGLDRPGGSSREKFPRIGDLIRIAIHEKAPETVLAWYDRCPKGRYGGFGPDTDEIAAAVEKHAPLRAVDIWKNKAEGLIAQVKPGAYQQAATYLRKAARVMAREKKTAEWEAYLKALRAKHYRKRRLEEILDQFDGRPIVKRGGTKGILNLKIDTMCLAGPM